MTGEPLPLGIRNNNPGNVLVSDQYVWRGQCGISQANNLRYCVFSDPIYGLRAVCIIWSNYEDHYQAHTLDDYCGLWSKGRRGGDLVYSATVAGWMGIPQSAPINIHDRTKDLLAAVVRMENGLQPYDDVTLYRAITASHSR